MTARAGWCNHGFEAELLAGVEAAFRLRGRTEPPCQPDLAECGAPRSNRRAAGRRRDRERDREIRSGLVDPDASRHVDEYVGLAEQDRRMAAEHRPNHPEPFRVDA